LAANQVTVRDVAQKAGVSISTVSRVLTGSARVSPELRQRVIDAVEELGYRPNALARGLRMRRTAVIGLLIPDISNPFFGQLARVVEDAANNRGYSILLCNSQNSRAREVQYLDLLRQQQVDGVLVVTSGAMGEELEEFFRSGVKTMMLCSPHNPVGRVWTKEELETLAELVLKYDVTVLSDEIWSDLVFAGSKHIPFATLAPEIAQRTVTFNAPSKTFNIAGLYVSNGIISNPQLRAKICQLMERLSVGAIGFFALVAAEAAYRSGAPWLDSLLTYLEENGNYVRQELGRIAPQIKINKPEGTYVLWLDCRELGLPYEELNQFFVQHAGLALNEGSAFGSAGLGFQRMNIGCPRSLIGEALRRIEHALSAL